MLIMKRKLVWGGEYPQPHEPHLGFVFGRGSKDNNTKITSICG